MSKRPAGESAEELESAMTVRAFLDRIEHSAWKHEDFAVGADGAELARTVCDFVQRKRAEHVLADTKERDRMYALGQKMWARMCATYDRLPADFPFRYVNVEFIWTGSDRHARIYAVFDGLTAIAEKADGQIEYYLETQDEAHRGWIGIVRAFVGRGARVAEDEAPLAVALNELIPGGMRELLGKMPAIGNLAGRDRDDDYGLFVLAPYCRTYGGFGDACPVIRVTTDEGSDTILFDGRAVCVRGSTPPADAPIPMFFDPVRNDAKFWRGLFSRAFVAK